MDKKNARNKAEAPSDGNKAEGFSQEEIDARKKDREAGIEAVKAKLAEVSDAELLDAYSEGEDFRRAVNDEAAKRGVALGTNVGFVRRDPAAAQTVGNFISRRALSGDRQYNVGDPREGKVGELIHLVESGAISPADDETAAAVKAFTGKDFAVYTVPAPAEAGEDA